MHGVSRDICTTLWSVPSACLMLEEGKTSDRHQFGVWRRADGGGERLGQQGLRKYAHHTYHDDNMVNKKGQQGSGRTNVGSACWRIEKFLVTVYCGDWAVLCLLRPRLSPPAPSLSPSSTTESALVQPCPPCDRSRAGSKTATGESAPSTNGAEKWVNHVHYCSFSVKYAHKTRASTFTPKGTWFQKEGAQTS